MQKIGMLKKFAIAAASAMVIWVMGTSSAFALYHDEWWTYFFKNSKSGELASFYIAWDAYGGIFPETTAKLFSKEVVPTKDVYPEWDYVGYGHFNRWRRDCYLLPEIVGSKFSSTRAVQLEEDECVYPERGQFELGTLAGGIWYFQALAVISAYLSPTFLLVTFYVFFAGTAFVRFLRIQKILPIWYANAVVPIVFWIFGWCFLYGEKYDQFDAFIYLFMLIAASPFFLAWFSDVLKRGKLGKGRFAWLVRFWIVQIFVFFALLFLMRKTGWNGIGIRFGIAMAFALLLGLAVKFKFLILPKDEKCEPTQEKSPS